MADEEPVVDGRPLSDLKVVDLKKELEKYGLSKSGNKKDLYERLKEYLTTGHSDDIASPRGSPKKTIGSPPPSLPGNVSDNPLIAEYLKKQQVQLEDARRNAELVRKQKQAVEVEASSPAEQPSPTKGSLTKSPRKTGGIDEHSNDETSEAQDSPMKASQKQDLVKPQPTANDKTADEDTQSTQESETTQESEEDAKTAEDAKKEHKGESKQQKSPQKTELSPSPKRLNGNKEREKSATPQPSPKKAIKAPSPKPEAQRETKAEAKPEPRAGAGEGNERERDQVEELDYEVDEMIEEKEKDKEGESEVREPHAQSRVAGRRESERKREEAVSDYIHVRGLTRPFTVKALREELEKFGNIEAFWIDNIKSHCIVQFDSVKAASAALETLHGKKWPDSNPKTLALHYSDKAAFDRHSAGAPAEAPAPLPQLEKRLSATSNTGITVTVKGERTSKDEPENQRKRKRSPTPPLYRLLEGKRSRDEPKKEREEPKEKKEEREKDRDKRRDDERRDDDRRREREERRPERKEPTPPPPPKSANDLFLKTKAQPSIYYLPLNDDQIAEKMARKAAEKAKREHEELAREKEREKRRRSVSRSRSRSPRRRR